MGKLKLLMGGSPCTHWSIAQTKNRETEPSGLGWELFLNYRIARDKYQPDYFLYENNKSMSLAIRAQITRELGVEPVLVNSALVSAQNRQRLYWFGKRNPDGTYSRVDVEQPEDRGILLRDILESGIARNEKAYCLAANRDGHSLAHDITKSKYAYAAEPVGINRLGGLYGQHTRWGIFDIDGKVPCLTASAGMGGGHLPMYPIRIGAIESAAAPKVGLDISKQYKVYSPYAKATALCGNGGGVGAKTGLYAVPVAGRIVGRRINEQGHRDDYNENIPHFQYFEVNDNPQKTNCLTTVQKDNMIIERWDGKAYPVYEVRDGLITIKGKQYPIKLADGYYIIRKLTVTECKRLQTVPDSYVFPVSDTQAYKLLGNGWTVDVIAHILSHIPEIATQPVEVLSMYDGMSCGHIALDKLGANVVRYYATETDKYAIQTTMANYPETVQLGNAFQVRDAGWAV